MISYVGYWDSNTATQEIYDDFINPVCEKYGITQAQLNILFFLQQYPQYDTATDMVRFRKMTKSHISISLNGLVDNGIVERTYKDGNRKTVHLVMTDKAAPILADGRAAQDKFNDLLFEGVPDELIESLHACARIMVSNGLKYLAEKESQNKK